MRKVECNVLSVREDLGAITSHILDMKSLMESKETGPAWAENTGALHCSDSNGVPSDGQATSRYMVSSCVQPQPRMTAQTVTASAVSAPLPLPRESIPSAENLGIAQLGSEQFSYDKTTVPSPPVIHLSQDINRLCREWEESHLLVVNGHGIPVKYWGEFYKRGKGVKATAWDALRVEWGNWKVSTPRNHESFIRTSMYLPPVHCRGASNVSQRGVVLECVQRQERKQVFLPANVGSAH